MKRVLIAGCSALAMVTMTHAQSMPEGKRLAELTFESVEGSDKGYLDQGDMERMRGLIFQSMDGDGDKKLSLAEYLSWDFGFASLAEETNRALAYETALKVVFSFHDRDGDGAITETEHRKSIMADFRRADLDDDAILTKGEFLGGFSVLVAVRSALKPKDE